MKIVVSSTGDGIDSQIDMRFGRCAYFLTVDVEDNEIKSVSAVKNEGAAQAHGAGVIAAQQVGNMKPDKLITGNLGPNASGIINQLGIETYQASGNLKDAVMQLVEGKLPKLENIVPEHSGAENTK